MTDIAGNSSTSSSIGVGGTVTGMLETAGDHDWFRITLSAGQSITVALNGVGTDPVDDTYLIIRDSYGNQVAFNDDNGSELNSLLSFTATNAGTYYIDVAAWSDPSQGYYGDTGGYQLSVRTYVPPPVFTNDQIADQLVNGFWENDGASARHFNVREGGTITVNLTGITSAAQNLARHALELWSDSLGIRFAETTGSAQITFSHDDGDATEDSAYSTSVTSGSYIISSQVNIDAGWVASYGTSLNSYSFQTYLHEIGHALGLGHAGNYNGTADYTTDALYQNDAWSTTVMSYFSQRENSYFSQRDFSYDYAVTPMVADLIAVSMLYGTPTTTRTGNTVYGFDSNADREVFDARANPNVAYTIIDSGGVDTLNYSHFSNDQRIDLRPEMFSNVGAGIGNVSIARGTVIEKAIGGSGDDIIIGNDANNTLTGGAGDDTLRGSDGNDRFVSGDGNDVMVGGSGIDTVLYDHASGAVNVDLAITIAQDTGSEGRDTLSEIERVNGSRFADAIYGDAADNVIYGHNGDDEIHGRGGNDRLTGDQENDLLYGDDGNDTLIGRTGADTLHAGNGNDRLYGEDGNDLIDGGAGTDIAYYVTATSGVTIDLGFTAGQDTVAAGIDTLAGIERIIASRFDDTLTGSAGTDRLDGRDGDDMINGGGGWDYVFGQNGNDTISGGDGNDRLYGGAGDDNFRFDSTPDGHTNWDTIQDFSASDDTVQLAQSVFSGIAASGTLDPDAFHLGTAAADVSDRIIYNQAGGRLYYDADGHGGASQVLFARIDPGTVLTNADFAVFGSGQTPLDSSKAATSDAFAVEPVSASLFTDAAHVDHLIG
jgi:serralysin